MSFKNRPKVLVIESSDPSKNIIQALENLEENNKLLKNSIQGNNDRLDWIRKLLKGI
jgi:hypothetical protein